MRGAVGEGGITVSARSDETGDNVEVVPADVSGGECEIAFNVGYMLDGLKPIDTDRVRLELTGESLPGVIKADGRDDYLHVIMPIHLGR